MLGGNTQTGVPVIEHRAVLAGVGVGVGEEGGHTYVRIHNYILSYYIHTVGTHNNNYQEVRIIGLLQ